MKWSKRTPYYAVSDCGRYTVSQATVQEGVMYTAWHTPTKTALLYTSDPKAAAKACATHKGN